MTTARLFAMSFACSFAVSFACLSIGTTETLAAGCEVTSGQFKGQQGTYDADGWCSIKTKNAEINVECTGNRCKDSTGGKKTITGTKRDPSNSNLHPGGFATNPNTTKPPLNQGASGKQGMSKTGKK